MALPSVFPLPISVALKPTAVTTVLAGLLLAGPVLAADREQSPHEHGVGQLNLAVEGSQVEIEITAPGADIVGFEHHPESDTDRQAVAAAVAKMKDAGALFRFPAKADCRLEEAEVQSSLMADDGHHEKGHGHEKDRDHNHGHGRGRGGEGHAEFRAHYQYHCADPAALSHVDLGYFQVFPAARELEAATITARGQGTQELTADRPRLNF